MAIALRAGIVFRTFVLAGCFAGIVDMYALQKLKSYSPLFSSRTFSDRNRRFAKRIRPIRWLVGDDGIDFLASRTVRFPLLEIVFALFAAASAARYGFGLTFGREVLYFALALPLAAISWQDTGGARAPKSLTSAAIGLGLATNSVFGWKVFLNSVAGSVVCFVVLYGVHSLNPRWLGFGNVKTGAVVGAFLGYDYRVLVAAQFLGFFIAAVVGVTLIMLRKISPRTELPFVPFQVLGGAVALLVPELLRWYLSH